MESERVRLLGDTPLHEQPMYSSTLNMMGTTRDAFTDTPAYEVLRKANLLCTQYRLECASEIEAIPANSTPWVNLALNVGCCLCRCCFTTFETPAGHVAMVEDGRGKFNFHSQGVHRLMDPFQRYVRQEKYGDSQIVHGDRNLVVIEQGFIGFALDKGQPVLLPPGMHQWRSSTIIYKGAFDLNNNVIQLGPLTLVTVDEGYLRSRRTTGSRRFSMEERHIFSITGTGSSGSLSPARCKAMSCSRSELPPQTMCSCRSTPQSSGESPMCMSPPKMLRTRSNHQVASADIQSHTNALASTHADGS